MIKYVANSFLATRISFINEIARLCEAHRRRRRPGRRRASPSTRASAATSSSPGIGYGGSCLPKDVAALRYIGETFGVATPVLSAVQEVNDGAAGERGPPPARPGSGRSRARSSRSGA